MRKHLTQIQKWLLCGSMVILILGILVHSLVLFMVNRHLNPDTPTPQEDYLEAMSQRISWRNFSQSICDISVTIYQYLQALFLFSIWQTRQKIAGKVLILYPISQVALFFLLPLLFGIWQPNWLADYVFPVWGMLGGFAILYLIFCVFYFFTQKRAQSINKPQKPFEE